MKLFQNAKGNWYASFEDQKGRRRYVSLRTKEKETADQIATELVPHDLSGIREPIQKEIARYLSDKAELRTIRWTEELRYVLESWAGDMNELGCSCVQEITTPKLQTWFYAKARTVKVTSAVSFLLQVRTFLKWARDERRLVLFNAGDKVKVPRHSKSVRLVFLPKQDCEKLIDHCVNEELRFALYCGLHAGFRYGEAIASRPEWFDLERKLIHIQVSDDWQPKNGKPRTVPMTDEFHEFLTIYGLRSPFMIAPEKVAKGKWRYRFDLVRRFQRLTMQLGINCTFHDLRRTFCSLKVSDGVSIYKVAKWAGHSVDVCEKHYGHLIPVDGEINRGVERLTPAPEVQAPEVSPHRQLTWEELRELVWSLPMTKAAREVGISDNGLRKWCNRLQVPLPPQGYWQVPPARRAKFLERAYRSHKGAVIPPNAEAVQLTGLKNQESLKKVAAAFPED
jgi:integrase